MLELRWAEMLNMAALCAIKLKVKDSATKNELALGTVHINIVKEPS